MITLKQIELWSNEEKAIVTWDVAFEEETDEGGNKHKVFTARRGNEVHRFSPNTTDEELQTQVKEMNGELM